MVIEDEVDVDVINIGCKVRIYDLGLKEELTYKIVGSTEANSLKGKISNESPLGRQLLGKEWEILLMSRPMERLSSIKYLRYRDQDKQ